MMMMMMMMMMMIGIVGALVKVLINFSSKCFQGWIVDQVGGMSFHSLAVLGKNECLCASILEYGMENRFLRVGLI